MLAVSSDSIAANDSLCEVQSPYSAYSPSTPTPSSQT